MQTNNKLRKAIAEILGIADHVQMRFEIPKLANQEISELKQIAEAALAEPVKNCAAHKREVDMLKRGCAELDAEVAAKDEVIKRLNDAISEEQRRKMATAEKSSAVGNVAKLREALATIRKRLVAAYESEACFMRYSPNKPLVDLIDAALAAPARNCDVYNNESCRMAYHLHGDGLMTMQAFADWLFAPATEQEGGDK